MYQLNQEISVTTPSGTEVQAKKPRRKLTADYKLRILEEIDRHPDQKGAILRREGLYSANVDAWRYARSEGSLSALNKARGRKPKKLSPQDQSLVDLKAQNAILQARLEKAELIIDFQKKVYEIFGVKSPIDEKRGPK